MVYYYRIEVSTHLIFAEVHPLYRFFFGLFVDAPSAHVIVSLILIQEFNSSFSLKDFVKAIHAGQLIIFHSGESYTVSDWVERLLDFVYVTAFLVDFSLSVRSLQFDGITALKIIECFTISQQDFSITDDRENFSINIPPGEENASSSCTYLVIT